MSPHDLDALWADLAAIRVEEDAPAPSDDVARRLAVDAMRRGRDLHGFAPRSLKELARIDEAMRQVAAFMASLEAEPTEMVVVLGTVAEFVGATFTVEELRGYATEAVHPDGR